MNFYNKYLELCTSIGERPSAVAAKIPISKSIVSRWKKGEGFPSDATLAKIAAYFNVQIEDLLADNKTPAATNGDGLSEEENDLIRLFRSAAPETRAAMLHLLRAAEAGRSIPDDAS